jgi:hypothetical protein
MKNSSLCEELAATLHKEFSGEEADFVGGKAGDSVVVFLNVLKDWRLETWQPATGRFLRRKNCQVHFL